MAHNGGVITAPVSFADVNAVLGTSHTQLTYLCTDNNIKMWAKYKPVVKNLIDTTGQLDNNKNWLSSATWWKGTSGNCGITYNSYTSVASAKSAIDAEMVVWGYTKPSGGSISPFRLIDFNQYNHNAVPPTTGLATSDAQLKAGAVLQVQLATSIDDGTMIKLSHIGSFDNYYYLAAIFDTSGNLKLLHTSSKKVGEYSDGESIEIDIPYNNGSYGYQGILSENTTYKTYVMMSSVAYTCATSAQSGTYIPLPTNNSTAGLQPVDTQAKASSQYAVFESTEAVGRIVSWTVNVYGGSLPTSSIIRLIYASTKQVVSGQSITFDYSSGATSISGGYTRSNKLAETLTCPDDNIDQYMIEFVSGSLSVRGIIAHDINENI